MRTKWMFIIMAAALVLSLPASAATVLQYEFDTDMDGNEPVTDAPIQPGPGAAAGVPDLSGNGYHLWGWCNAAGDDNNSPLFSSEAPDDYGYSIYFDGGLDGYTSGATDLNAWSPETWTIELAVMLTDVSGWRTIIGRDGSTAPAEAAADFYFQKAGDTNTFRINYRPVNADRVVLDSDFTPVANQWYRMAVVSDGVTLTMYADQLDGNGYQSVGSVALPGATPADNAPIATDFIWTFGRGWFDGSGADSVLGYIDDVRFSDTALEPWQFGLIMTAYDPDPQPLNADGSVGTAVGNQAAGITLNFKAARDPNTATGNLVHPGILEHYIYLSDGVDPEPVFVASVPQTDPMEPVVSYALPDPLMEGTEYFWKVEEGLDDGTGAAYAPGDPNNIVGRTWSFTTVAVSPTILSGPRNAVADATGTATLSVTGSATAQSYEWYRVGTPDLLLTDGGKYSGATTSTLTITGVTLADEGQYYCIAYNGMTPSIPSPTAQVLTPRLVGYWKFDGSLADSVDLEVSGVPTHDGTMTVSTDQAGPGDPNYVGDGNGVAGDAMSFHGDGDIVTIAGPDFFNFYHEGFTISFWYQAFEPLVEWRLPMAKLDAGSAGWLFGTDHTAPSPFFSFIVESPWNRLDGAATPDVGDGQWHLFTATYDSQTDVLRVFTNGEQDAQATVDLGDAPLAEAPITIGGRDTELAINGAIDEVRMYSYALTPEQVAGELYMAHRPGEFVCIIPDGSEFASFDLTGDCRVTLEDFMLIAQEWLECQRIPQEACDW